MRPKNLGLHGRIKQNPYLIENYRDPMDVPIRCLIVLAGALSTILLIVQVLHKI